MSNYKNVQNYSCKLLGRIKTIIAQDTIALGHNIVICLNKELCVIACGWVPKCKQVEDVYIPYYLTPNEYKNLTEKQYTEIIYKLINEHKKILNKQKIKELEKDFKHDIK